MLDIVNFEKSKAEKEKIKGQIKIDEVSITFGKGDTAHQAVSSTSLDISAGEFVCILGPSGCGKSTTCTMVSGLLDPSLELDELASGRLDVERHASSPRSGAVFWVVLRDEFLVKADEVLRVDAGHEFPAKVEGFGDGTVLVTALSQ